MRDARCSGANASRIPHPASRHFVPCQRADLLAALADQLLHVRLKPLPVAAGGAHGVREGEQAPHPLNLARLAPDDAPPLGGMIADLEEAPVDRHVPSIDVQHHDVTRGDADDGVPRAAAQQMRAGPSDPRPSLGLEARRRHGAKGHAHARTIPSSRDGSRDWGHTYRSRKNVTHDTRAPRAPAPPPQDGALTTAPTTSPALREAAHVALGAALDEGELRSAIGAGADEVVCGTGPPALTRRPLGAGDAPLDGSRSRWHRATQQILLDALLLLHPFLNR